MMSALAAWLMLLSYFSASSTQPNHPTSKSQSRIPAIKPEPSDSENLNPFHTGDLSDTPRSFPTLGRQVPLHFSDRKEARLKEEEQERDVKREEEKEEEGYMRSKAIQHLPAATAAVAAEADDENEDDDDEIPFDASSGRWRDSGIGTSLDDGNGVEYQPRRRKGVR